jgi:N-dimethylarginine dimethylaminohydrolase
MFESLRRVLVRRPSVPACALWREYGWRAEPDSARLLAEHEAFWALLAASGAEVVVAEPLEDDPDAIYTFDPGLVTEDGAILLRPGKPKRRREAETVEADLVRAGVAIAGRLRDPGIAEGGDFIRLDERTLLAGRSYRTNEDGIRQVGDLLSDVETIAFDLPHWHGTEEVMHLLSLLSPLDIDLVVAYPPLLPVSLMQLLAGRGVEIVPVPDDEFHTMGTNVLALAPRRALALDGNPATRRRLETAGVEVQVYQGKELSLKGDGGPTCLAMPLLRA